MMRGMAIFFCFLPFSDLSRITLTTLVERNGEEIERLFHLYVNMSSAYNTLRQKSIYVQKRKEKMVLGFFWRENSKIGPKFGYFPAVCK